MHIYIGQISPQSREPYIFLNILRTVSRSSTRDAYLFTLRRGALLSTTAQSDNANEPRQSTGDAHPYRYALNGANYFLS
jgi:hypothetical protein